MKHLSIIKITECRQLGHLYEHLFLRHINDLMYTHGLVKELDYSAHGTSYGHGGVIRIDVAAYTEEAEKYISDVIDLDITYGHENRHISIALSQIMTELEYQVGFENNKICSWNDFIPYLDKIHNQPWQNLRDIDIVDCKQLRTKNTPLFETSTPQPKPRQFRMTIELDRDFSKQNRELIPLFSFVTSCILHTLATRLCDEYGFYSRDITSTKTPIAKHCALDVMPSESFRVNLETISQLCRSTVDRIISHGFAQRLAHNLVTLSANHDQEDLPDADAILQEFGVLIGDKGWQRYATPENIIILLKKSHLRLRFGRTKLEEYIVE